MELLFLWFIGSIFLLFFWIYWLLSDSRSHPRIHGIYGQRGPLYSLKYNIASLLVMLRRRSIQNPEFYETKRALQGDLPCAADRLFFSAASREGWNLVVSFIQRHEEMASFYCLLRIPNLGFFVNEELLDSSNVNVNGAYLTDYRTKSGFRIRCDEPSKKWTLSFQGNFLAAGNLIPDLNSIGKDPVSVQPKPAAVSLNLEFTSDAKLLDTNSIVSTDLMASCIAREPWDMSMLKKIRQKEAVHYEQVGHLRGSVVLDGQELLADMSCFREHTIAPDWDWRDIRRYVKIAFHLEDGTFVNNFCMSMPDHFFSQLQSGYVTYPDGNVSQLSRLDLNLGFIGEDKKFPDSFNYTFDTNSVFRVQTVHANVVERTKFKVGLDLSCYVEELFCEFTMNGLRGFGICEVEYRIKPY